MQDLIEIHRLHVELERLKKKTLGANCLTHAGISEELFARLMTEIHGRPFNRLGGNTSGYDVIDIKTGDTYEVKSTQTSCQAYNFGNLLDKSANYCVFVKWTYDQIMQLEYCYVIQTVDVIKNLNSRGKLTYKKMLDLSVNGLDLTNQMKHKIKSV